MAIDKAELVIVIVLRKLAAAQIVQVILMADENEG